MIYILLVWTVVAGAGTQTMTNYKYDWRPLGEFHKENAYEGKSAGQMCEEAARQLALKADAYRCVRSK